VNVTKNVALINEVLLNIKLWFDYLQARIGTNVIFNDLFLQKLIKNHILGEGNESDQRFKFVGLCSLYVFSYKLFHPQIDKKFFKSLWLMHKKVYLFLIIYLFTYFIDFKNKNKNKNKNKTQSASYCFIFWKYYLDPIKIF